MKPERGRWHGDQYYFGMHYDLHAGPGDTELGARCGPKDLTPTLKLMAPQFVQTDCKGHAGYTSWFSKVPDASVSPGVVKDALMQWRKVTRQLGLPLHCHYSGIWDAAAGKKHPAWCVRGPDQKPTGAPFGPDKEKQTGQKMCPRSPYLEKLMIPQLIELIERYKVDGFWIDGDIWAVEPCYCRKCRKAFRDQTGIAEPPAETEDPNWALWWNFTLESFEEYVTRYCDAVHSHKTGALVCSNWLQTFRHPGEPKVQTDWISGDNSWVWGMDGSRCEARFLSTRGKPWDIMLWSFYCSHGMGAKDSPWVEKPVEMLQQEAAVILAFGGNVQVYEHPWSLRNGQLVPWRQKRLGEVGRFAKKRRSVCQGAETIPQVAVLHSETHLRATPSGRNLFWGLDDAPVQGAVFSLLECHYGVDILDEWALLQRLACISRESLARGDAQHRGDKQPCLSAHLTSTERLAGSRRLQARSGSAVPAEMPLDGADKQAACRHDGTASSCCEESGPGDFPVIVAPERHEMSEDLVAALKAYVKAGGRLLVSGAKSFDRFGEDFLGVTAGTLEEDKVYCVPAADGAAPTHSDTWRLVEYTSAKPLGRLGTSELLDERLLPYPSATVNRVGRGAVAYVPCSVFRYFQRNRYPFTRAFIGEVVKALRPKLDIRVKAPTAIDVVLRQKKSRKLVHLINRSSGLPNLPNSGAIDEIPPVGPVEVTLNLSKKPRSVRLALEKSEVTTKWKPRSEGGRLAVTVPSVRIHSVLVIET